MDTVPQSLALIAGRGAYPLQLAASARQQGVGTLFAVAFRGETDRRIAERVDAVVWIRVGELGRMLDALRGSRARVAVMAGQIRPRNLFRVHMDAPMRALLRRLSVRNAETIFGAVGDELAGIGVELLPASRFMEAHMPAAGRLSARELTPSEQDDVALGLRIAKTSSGLDIGQSVVVKEGTILAVEAFEGTDAAIRRAAHLGGRGCVVVKVAKDGQDMRFDIPVIGRRTARTLRKARAAVLAIEAGRCILLERERVLHEIDRMGMAMVAVESEQTDG